MCREVAAGFGERANAHACRAFVAAAPVFREARVPSFSAPHRRRTAGKRRAKMVGRDARQKAAPR